MSAVSAATAAAGRTATDAGLLPHRRDRALVRVVPPGVSIIQGFWPELFPALLVVWSAVVAGWAISGRPYFVPLGIWASVTLLMLWPVGRRLRRTYFSYRSPLFILGVLSMAYIPFIGFVIESAAPYWVKVVLWLLLPVDLTVFGFLPALQSAIRKPIRMFFRPDLLFGDGRVLAGGIVAAALGLRYVLGAPPPAGTAIAIPAWNWWAMAFAMAAGFIPMIPVRGVHKLVTRVTRMASGRWGGWDAVLFKEGLLVTAALSIGWGFHHVFGGAIPFTAMSWRMIGMAHGLGHHPLGWLLVILGAIWLIVVRGGYKKAIGEPFIKESVGQTWIKEGLLVVGLLPLLGGFMLLVGGPFGRWNPWPHAVIGLLFLLWGLVMLLPLRVIAQIRQRRAIVQQMAAVILPAYPADVRQRLLSTLLAGLATLREGERYRYLRAMREALNDALEENRQLMTQAVLAALVELSSDERRACMRTMDTVIQHVG